MISIRGLRYAYPGAASPALGGVDLDLGAGERLLVAGPSGSGKSTLLRCLDGLVPHFHGGRLAGRIEVAGRDPVTAAPAGMADAVGFVFQDPEAQRVAPRVEDEVAFGLENLGLPPAEIGRRIGAALERLGAGALRRRRIETLSGGERQRVAIAAALCAEPPVAVLDEPTSQLDPGGVGALVELLGHLHRTGGLTLVIAEHRLGRLIEVADRACVLAGAGAPPRVGTPAEALAASPLAPPVARLGAALGWEPVPLTVGEARSRLRSHPPRPVPGGRANPSPTPGEILLTARGLRHRYPASGAEALAGVDLEIRCGEVVALLGANGSGKSTLLRALVGLLRPDGGADGGADGGEVAALGRPHAGRPVHEIARSVGLVPQDPGRLLFADSVAAEVRFTRRAHGLPEGDPGELLARLGIAHLAGADPRDLSGGERQRAALAAILAAAPPVLLLDEPTRGLDPPAKEALAALLRALAAGGAGIVVATHDAELAAACAGRAVILDRGRVAADGPPAEVLPGTPYEPEISRLLGVPGVLTVADALAVLR